MKRVGALLVAGWLLCGTGLAYADGSWLGFGNSVEAYAASEDYDAVPFQWADAVALGTVAGGVLLGASSTVGLEVSLQAIAPTIFLTWGAWRTAQYRPQAEKDRVTANLVGKSTSLLPGAY